MDEELLKMARAGFQQQADMIKAKIAEIDAQLSGKKLSGRPAATVKPIALVPQKGKRNLSAAARKAIGDAARKRWAAHRKAKKVA